MSAISITNLACATSSGLFFLRGTNKVMGDIFNDSPEPPLTMYGANSPIDAIGKTSTSAKGDKARTAAVIGQGVNVFKNIAASGADKANFATSVVSAIDKTAKLDSALGQLAKGVQLASNNVNPFLCAASAYRVLSADDKKTAFARESCSMSGMFAAEKAMKMARSSTFVNNLRKSVEKSNSKYAKLAFAIVEGGSFVLGSIAGFDAGAKVGNSLLDIKKYQ